MRLVIRKRNEEKSNSCRSKWKVNDCLKWLSMKQNNIWHRPTLTLIGRRGLNYGKEVVNSTDIWTGEIRSPSSSSTKEEWSLTSWHNIKKVASGWNRKRGPSLDKIMKMDHDNLRKVLQWQASWQTKPKQEGSSTIRKQQSGMSGLEWDLPNHWKAAPMMKNRPAIFKKVKSW